MPRIGMNPSRGRKTDYQPARVTVAVLTYLPDHTGYFQDRFDVTRLCLESIIANTSEPYDLLVFDNGSCDALVDYLRGLRDRGLVKYLILSSQNIGNQTFVVEIDNGRIGLRRRATADDRCDSTSLEPV